MEFPFDVGKALPGAVTILETGFNESDIRIYSLDTNSNQVNKQESNSSWIYHSSANAPWDIKLKKRKEDLVTIVDNIGYASAQAQNLRTSITSLKKLLNSKNQKVYVMRDIENNNLVIGFLKVGVKRLFVCDDAGAHHEVDPLCVLDFYVHESRQRCGYGHQLFNIMLKEENISPEKLAIDRPSVKFLSFLKKHYSLNNPIPQTNNFVIFPGFFLNRKDTRPPIFLYSGKAMQPVESNNLKTKHQGSYAKEIEALDSVKVPLRSEELKKNKTFYSSAARCLMWDDGENFSVYNKNSPKASSRSVSTNSSNTKSSYNWNLQTPVQSCAGSLKKTKEWNSNLSSPCSLTPVGDVPFYSRRKWDQMQSSWNILGVKPVDYTLYQKQN